MLRWIGRCLKHLLSSELPAGADEADYTTTIQAALQILAGASTRHPTWSSSLRRRLLDARAIFYQSRAGRNIHAGVPIGVPPRSNSNETRSRILLTFPCRAAVMVARIGGLLPAADEHCLKTTEAPTADADAAACVYDLILDSDAETSSSDDDQFDTVRSGPVLLTPVRQHANRTSSVGKLTPQGNAPTAVNGVQTGLTLQNTPKLEHQSVSVFSTPAPSTPRPQNGENVAQGSDRKVSAPSGFFESPVKYESQSSCGCCPSKRRRQLKQFCANLSSVFFCLTFCCGIPIIALAVAFSVSEVDCDDYLNSECWAELTQAVVGDYKPRCKSTSSCEELGADTWKPLDAFDHMSCAEETVEMSFAGPILSELVVLPATLHFVDDDGSGSSWDDSSGSGRYTNESLDLLLNESLGAVRAVHPEVPLCFGDGVVRHPELKLTIPPQLFCMSWCPDFEFRGTYRSRPASELRINIAMNAEPDCAL